MGVLGVHEGEGTEELVRLQSYLLRDPATAPVLGHSYRQFRSASGPMKGVLVPPLPPACILCRLFGCAAGGVGAEGQPARLVGFARRALL